MTLNEAIELLTDLREKMDGNGDVKLFVPLDKDGETIGELEKQISLLVDDGEKPGFLRPITDEDEDLEVAGIVLWAANGQSDDEAQPGDDDAPQQEGPQAGA